MTQKDFILPVTTALVVGVSVFYWLSRDSSEQKTELSQIPNRALLQSGENAEVTASKKNISATQIISQEESPTQPAAIMNEANQALVDAIQQGHPVALKIGRLERQLLLAPRQVFDEGAAVRRLDGTVLFEQSDVHVFGGGVAPASVSVSKDLIGVLPEQEPTAFEVPHNGLTARELLAQFDAEAASMTVIGDQVALSLRNVNRDQILLRNNPETGEMEMRYESTAMHQAAFGTCQAAACTHDHHTPETPEQIAADFQKIDEMIAASGGIPMADSNVWVSLGEASLTPDEGYIEGPDEQAIVQTVGTDPATGLTTQIGNPVPLGPKYLESLRKYTYIAQAEPELYKNDFTGVIPLDPTDQELSVMLCRLLLTMEQVQEIYERNMAINMVLGDLMIRYLDDPFWESDRKGDDIAYTWRGGQDNMIARARFTDWNGGGAAAKRNLGISAWPIGAAHEIGHVLGCGHTDGDLMHPNGGVAAHFWGLAIGSQRQTADTIYLRSAIRDDDTAEYQRERGLEDPDLIDGEGSGILSSQNVTSRSWRNPKEIAFADDDKVVTAINTTVEFDPLANDDRRVPHSLYYNEHLSIEEVGRVIPEGAGTLEIIDSTQRFRFTPATGFEGTVQFNYTLRGSVGNQGRGWLSRALVSIVVGNAVNDPLNVTIAPGEDVWLRFPEWSDVRTLSSSYPVQASLNSPIGQNILIVRAHPDASGSEQFQVHNNIGSFRTVTLTYSNPTRNTVDDFYSADHRKHIRFNPLANDNVTGDLHQEYQIATEVSQVLDPVTDRNTDHNRSYRLLSATLDTPSMGELEVETSYRTFPDGSWGAGPTNFLVFKPAPGASGYAEITYTAQDVDGTQFVGTAKVLVGLADVVRPFRNYTRLREDMGLVLETQLIPASGTGFTGTSTLLWDVLEKPDGSTVSFEDPTSTSTVAHFDHPGRYRLRLQADDNGNVKTIERWVFVEAINAPLASDVEHAPWINADKLQLSGWNQANWNTSELGISVHDDAFANLIDLSRLGTTSTVNGVKELDLGAEYPVQWVDLFFDIFAAAEDHILRIDLLDTNRSAVQSYTPQRQVFDQTQYRIPVSTTGENTIRYVSVVPLNDDAAIPVTTFRVMGFSGDLIDITRLGDAAQSTTNNNDSDFNARRAIDNLTGYNHGSRTDATTLDNWWEFTLDQETELSAIFLDLENTNANNGTVTVFNDADVQVWQTTLDNNKRQALTNIPVGTMAKRIRIAVQTGTAKRLSIQEFLAFGKAPATLTTQWSQTNSAHGTSFGDTSSVQSSVNLTGGNGSYTLRLTADDGWNKTVKDFPVDYDAASTAPTGFGLSDLAISNAGGPQSIDLLSAFNGATSYEVIAVGDPSLFDGNPLGVIGDPANFALNTAAGVTGSSSVTIRATDGNGNHTDLSFEIRTENLPPQVPEVITITIPEFSSTGAFADLNTYVTDLEGDPLSFTFYDSGLMNSRSPWLGKSSNGTLSLGSAFGITTASRHLVKWNVSVSDGINPPVPFSLNLILEDENSRPTLQGATLSVGETVLLNEPFHHMEFIGTDEPDEVYAWEIVSGNAAGDWSIDPDTGALIPVKTPNKSVTAQYSFLVRATDSFNDTAEATVTLNILNATDEGDSDADQLSDWWETTYLGNITDFNASDDPDKDGLTNLDEQTLNTSPTTSAYFQTWKTEAEKDTTLRHLSGALPGNETRTLDLSSLGNNVSYEFFTCVGDLNRNSQLLSTGSWFFRFEQHDQTGQLGVTQVGVLNHLFTAESGQVLTSPYDRLAHIVFVVDKGSSETRVYVDGVLVGRMTPRPNLATTSVQLGQTTLRDDAGPGILAFAAYDSVLTQAEITARYNAWTGTNLPPVVSDQSIAIESASTPSGTQVLTVDAADPEGTAVSLTISAGNEDGLFNLDASGNLTTTGALPTHATYRLTIDATDADSQTGSALITVTVGLGNEVPVITPVGKPSVTATFTGNSSAQGATLYTETVNGLTMTIVPESNHTAVDTLGFKTNRIGVTGGAGTAGSKDSQISSGEKMIFSFDRDVFLQLWNSDNAKATEVSILTSTAFDGLTGVTGGTYDDANDRITLLGGNDVNLDDDSAESGIFLPQGTTFDFTSGSDKVSFDYLRVTTPDRNPKIAENAANRTTVINIEATDADPLDTLSYAIISGNTGNAFTIDSNGRITQNGSLDFDTTPSYSLVVQVTDSKGSSATEDVVVSVLEASYENYEQTYFADHTQHIGEEDDFDFDGISNLLEYALGMNPTIANATSPVQMATAGNMMSLTFDEDTRLTDITITFETSATLAPGSWTTNGITITHGTPDASGMRSMKGEIPMGSDKAFLRVVVTRN